MPLDTDQAKPPLELWRDAIVKGLNMDAEVEERFRAACALWDAEKMVTDGKLVA